MLVYKEQVEWKKKSSLVNLVEEETRKKVVILRLTMCFFWEADIPDYLNSHLTLSDRKLIEKMDEKLYLGGD